MVNDETAEGSEEDSLMHFYVRITCYNIYATHTHSYTQSNNLLIISIESESFDDSFCVIEICRLCSYHTVYYLSASTVYIYIVMWLNIYGQHIQTEAYLEAEIMRYTQLNWKICVHPHDALIIYLDLDD